MLADMTFKYMWHLKGLLAQQDVSNGYMHPILPLH